VTGVRHSVDPPSAGPPAATQDALAALLAKSQNENFPVASRVLPRALRRDLMALYGFARLVDDAGDENGTIGVDERLRLLDAIEAELDLIWSGEPTWPVLRTLATTVHAHAIPDEPFRRLIEANRIDQRVATYERYADLVEYCTYSADPVGRVVLYLTDSATPERVTLSDQVCTALQLLEHSQDVGEDHRRGRVYLPLEDLAAAGIDPAALDHELTAAHASPRLRQAVAALADRGRTLLADGAPLVGTLTGFARLAVAGYVAGGLATAHALRAADHDVLAGTPKPGRVRTLMGTVRLAALPVRSVPNGRAREVPDGEH
jgi:squalene synthase HpnC